MRFPVRSIGVVFAAFLLTDRPVSARPPEHDPLHDTPAVTPQAGTSLQGAAQAGGCCLPDGSCLDVAAETDCTSAGGVFQGAGTDCFPNCCVQPVPTGGDNCSLVTLHSITIPSAGEPPVEVTITGNNGGATFDEFGVWTNSTIFDPNGSTRDPGWWEGFELVGGPTACADVRIDLCCSNCNGNIVRPAWTDLWAGCPEEEVLLPECAEPPIGSGVFPLCSDTLRGAPFCDGDNLWMTFASLRPGRYFYPIYSAPGGTSAVPPGCDYQMHITVGACPVAACCTGQTCQLTNRFECEAIGGYWLHEDNTGGVRVTSCGDATPENPNPCAFGSCCLDPETNPPAVCEDATDPNVPCDPLNPATCMDASTCAGLGGTYVGGARCDNPLEPCNVCKIASDTTCMVPDFLNDFVTWQMADLSAPPDGVITADDFVAGGTTIRSVCFWGTYMRRNAQDATTQSNGQDCSGDISDDFRIRVYEDAGGRPGVLVSESRPAVLARDPVHSRAQEVWLAFQQLYGYFATLDPPITGLSPGTRYWMEIVNNTVEDDTCLWHWFNSGAGNRYSVVGTDGTGYPAGSERGTDSYADHAFCVDQTITAPTADVGTCCPCNGDPCASTTLAECPPTVGTWSLGGVPDITVGHDECADAVPLAGGLVTVPTDTTCATTNPADPSHGSVGLGGDIWYTYVAGGSAKLVVRAGMCATGNGDNTYDSALAVYRNPVDPKSCPAACPQAGGVLVGGSLNDMDEGCNSVGDEGAGILEIAEVEPGDCFAIRVGGFNGDVGRGMLSVGVHEIPCPLSQAPRLEQIPVGGGGQADLRNLRTLPLVIDEPGSKAVRVRFESLPPPFDIADGAAMWLGPPFQVCENAGQAVRDDPSACVTPPPPTPVTAWYAPLQCDPFYMDWSTIPAAINAYGEFVVPDGTYAVQVIDEICLREEGNFSDPLLVQTPTWADLVGDCAQQPCTPPDGSTEVTTDVTAVLNKFKNLAIGARKARADVEPAIPDQLVNISDVTDVLDAFRGAAYPFVPSTAPCP